jgi:hypothetical protein
MLEFLQISQRLLKTKLEGKMVPANLSEAPQNETRRENGDSPRFLDFVLYPRLRPLPSKVV